MTKKELIKKSLKQIKLPLLLQKHFTKTLEHVLIEAIASHKKVILALTIGRFVLRSRKTYIGSNAQTGKKSKSLLPRALFLK
ncbi:MAG: HU family DNA-binding protein [Candidatus Phytoplasma australasiaticum]|nr:HU family DNA-binding protein [Candidatus Phytoplasma australasiaticum]